MSGERGNVWPRLPLLPVSAFMQGVGWWRCVCLPIRNSLMWLKSIELGITSHRFPVTASVLEQFYKSGQSEEWQRWSIPTFSSMQDRVSIWIFMHLWKALNRPERSCIAFQSPATGTFLKRTVCSFWENVCEEEWGGGGKRERMSTMHWTILSLVEFGLETKVCMAYISAKTWLWVSFHPVLYTVPCNSVFIARTKFIFM